jgi:ferredoxin
MSALPDPGMVNGAVTAVRRFTVRVAGFDGGFACRADQRVLEALAATPFGGPGRPTRPDLKIGCRRGGCGICRVRVLAGCYETTVMSAAFVDEGERGEGYALACCLYPRSDLVVQPARKPRPAPGSAGAAGGDSPWPRDAAVRAPGE